MNKFQDFQKFFEAQSGSVTFIGFMINLFLAAILSYILAKIYVKYGTSLSNRRMFAKNFILITMTTMLIITIVKSSLALSLGLVGALSIVRFRAAIKEPEELAYLFLAITIGLGIGANQRIITTLALVVICGIILLRRYKHISEFNQNLYLTITSHNQKNVSLEKIIEILKKYCSAVVLKRFDESKEMLEASFLIEFDKFEQLQKAKSELQKSNDSLNITFLDNRGVFD